MIVRIKKCIFKIIYILVIIYLLVFIPTIWGHKPLVVISGSMEPTLKVGGILYYHHNDYEDFKVDDILVYRLNDHNISHRVYDITDNGIITKGDANKTYDDLLITENRILGKGTDWCIPFIGYYADYIYRHKYLLVISIVAIVIDMIFDKKRKQVLKMKKALKLSLLILALFTTIKVTSAYFNTTTDFINEINTKNYLIVFDANGGNFKKYRSAINDGIFELPVPTRSGHLFLGYGITPNGSVRYYNRFASIYTITSDRLYAIWETNSYSVNVSSIVDDTTYTSGLAGFTFDVWVNDVLVADDVIDWSETLEYGTKVRIKTNDAVGRATSYDTTKNISGTTTLNPNWITNAYESHFYLNGNHVLTTYNSYGATVSTPNTSASALGYDANFYYLSGYTPWTSWIQQEYPIGFTINIAEHGCTVTFGTRSVANADAQLTKLHNAGYTYCVSAGTGVGCYANYSRALELYNNGWNILPSSGSGYSIYKSMSCDSGWGTEAKR